MKKSLLFISILLFGMLLMGGVSVLAQTKKVESNKLTKPIPLPLQAVQANQNTKADTVYLSQIELEILKEINLARTDPKLYVTYLEEYRKFYNGNNLSLPNQRMIVTNEGVAAVDDAIKALKAANIIAALESSEFVSRATKDHLQDLVKNSIFGHKGSDGSMTDGRLNKYIYIETIRFGENVVMSGLSAREVVLAMLIDDGVPSRSHRKNVLDPEFKFIGLSNGVNKTQKGLSVVIFTTGAKERNEVKPVATNQAKQIL